MKIFELLESFYSGAALEAGGTSIKSGAAPALKALFNKEIMTDDVVLDYGAGKHARNADWLRDQGVKCYAYDPFNYNGAEGWKKGSVSEKLPRQKFDVVFTSFVLNVVPKHLEDEIIKKTNRLAKKHIHIVRNMDVFDTVKPAIKRRDKVVWEFFINEFWKKKKEPTDADLTDKLILDLCEFGVQTSKGFQRIPHLEDHGFKLVKKTHGYKVYIK